MEHYLLFEGETYYPGGGTGDLVGLFSTLEQALQHSQAHGLMMWGEIVKVTEDRIELVMLYGSENGKTGSRWAPLHPAKTNPPFLLGEIRGG